MKNNKEAAKIIAINDVIRLLRTCQESQESQKDPLQYARIGEAIWTLQDLRDDKI